MSIFHVLNDHSVDCKRIELLMEAETALPCQSVPLTPFSLSGLLSLIMLLIVLAGMLAISNTK